MFSFEYTEITDGGMPTFLLKKANGETLNFYFADSDRDKAYKMMMKYIKDFENTKKTP